MSATRPKAQVLGELLYEWENSPDGWTRTLTMDETYALLEALADWHKPIEHAEGDLPRALAKLRQATEFALAYPTVAITRAEAHAVLNELGGRS